MARQVLVSMLGGEVTADVEVQGNTILGVYFTNNSPIYWALAWAQKEDGTRWTERDIAPLAVDEFRPAPVGWDIRDVRPNGSVGGAFYLRTDI